MSKFYCGLSGLECQVSYLPITLSSREYAHPIFFVPQKKLLGLFSRYESGNMEDTESYLLYLALFNSTDLVEFRVPATFHKTTPAIVASNMERLCSVVFKLNAITVPSFQVPRFAVTPETKTLENSKHWITAWEHAIESFLEGNRRRILSEELDVIEERIYKYVLDPTVKPAKYASALSLWAAKAASFPEFQVTTQFGTMSCSDYWQLIIRKCVNEAAIFDIPKEDIAELVTHCEDTLELGTLYATSLLKLLHEGRDRQISYLGLGDLDLYNIETPYQILDASTDICDANMISVVQAAPKEEPKRTDYATEFEFQRARIRFLAAQRTTIQTSI